MEYVCVTVNVNSASVCSQHCLVTCSRAKFVCCQLPGKHWTEQLLGACSGLLMRFYPAVRYVCLVVMKARPVIQLLVYIVCIVRI